MVRGRRVWTTERGDSGRRGVSTWMLSHTSRGSLWLRSGTCLSAGLFPLLLVGSACRTRSHATGLDIVPTVGRWRSGRPAVPRRPWRRRRRCTLERIKQFDLDDVVSPPWLRPETKREPQHVRISVGGDDGERLRGDAVVELPCGDVGVMALGTVGHDGPSTTRSGAGTRRKHRAI